MVRGITIANPATVAAPGGHYSHAVAGNGFVFVSGQLPIAPDGSKLNEAPFEKQAQQVLDNVAAALTGAAVQKAAGRVGLLDRLESKAGELSRGLRQRLAIGQSIVHEPHVLLLDEPAAGLDPQARRDLSTLLIALRDGGMTLVVSSHILAELEDYCSEMIIIENGLIAGGKAIKVRDDARPRYMIELATARSDLKEFLGARGAEVVEADQIHALIVFTRNAGARAKLVRELVGAGFDIAAFAESSKALEDAYFAQVGRRA